MRMWSAKSDRLPADKIYAELERSGIPVKADSGLRKRIQNALNLRSERRKGNDATNKPGWDWVKRPGPRQRV